MKKLIKIIYGIIAGVVTFYMAFLCKDDTLSISLAIAIMGAFIIMKPKSWDE